MSQAVEAFRGSAKAKSILGKLTDFPNVPRKKAKFFNFMKNSFRSYGVNDSILEEIWNVIEEFDKATKQQTPQSNGTDHTKASNGNSINQPLKRKLEYEDEEEEKKEEPPVKLTAINDTENNENGSKFDWVNEIKKICSKKDQNQIKFEKLIKKVIKILVTSKKKCCTLKIETKFCI